MSSRKRRRTYDNSLRQARASETRERILASLADELGDVPVDELSVARIARRAGVSEPTVYRHFPNRQALLDGFMEMWKQRARGPSLDHSIEQVDETIPALFEHFEHNRPMVVAANQSHSLASKADAPNRARRIRQFKEQMAPLVSHLDDDTAAAITAVIRQIYSARTWVALVEDYGLTSERAAVGVQWALKTLLAELKRGKSRAQHNQDTEA